MSDALTIAAASMMDDMQRMAAISNNLANVTTTGFKRELAAQGSFIDYVLSPETKSAALTVRLPATHLLVDHRPGSLRHTGNALDLALEEDGYFELTGPQGPLYTRQGSFQVDASGRLVNAEGLPVMGIAGEIQLANAEPRIERDGRIFDQDKAIGQLRVVRFPDARVLEKAGAGTFVASEDHVAQQAPGSIRQGHLENSNVVTSNEMVRMIETLRHFETNQKLIQSYDDMLERAVRTLGDF